MERRIISSSGIPIYSYQNPAQNSFFISLYLRSGSMYESPEENGINHFLEHALIRNIDRLMSGELYPTLDRYGIEFNAATYNEMVQFYISGARENFKIGADIISLALMPIVLSAEEISAERDRIRREIREADEAGSLAGFTSKEVYSGTSLAMPIAGTPGSIRKIGKMSLERYRKSAFTKENLFFYLTGNVTEADALYLSEKLRDVKLGSGAAHGNIAPVPATFGKRCACVVVKGATFTKLRFSFDVDMSRVSLPELDMLYEQLLGGYSSELFVELSERRGLFYDLVGTVERYRNIGVFSFSFELAPSKLEAATGMTVDILRKIKTEAVPRDKFMAASYVDNAMMLYDDARELNFTLAYDNHIMGIGYADLGARRDAYARISPEDVRRVASEIFRTDNLTLTLKGQKKKINTERLREIIATLGN